MGHPFSHLAFVSFALYWVKLSVAPLPTARNRWRLEFRSHTHIHTQTTNTKPYQFLPNSSALQMLKCNDFIISFIVSARHQHGCSRRAHANATRAAVRVGCSTTRPECSVQLARPRAWGRRFGHQSDQSDQPPKPKRHAGVMLLMALINFNPFYFLISYPVQPAGGGFLRHLALWPPYPRPRPGSRKWVVKVECYWFSWRSAKARCRCPIAC